MVEEERPEIVKTARTLMDRTKDAAYIGTVVVVVLVGVLKWYRETYPPTEPATAVQMVPRFDSVESKIDGLDRRLTVYQDSLGRLYTFVDTAIAKPSLGMLSWALKRLDRLESLSAESRMDNLALKNQVSNSTMSVVAEMRRSSTVNENDELLRDLIEEVRAVRLDNAQIKKKLKITESFDTR